MDMNYIGMKTGGWHKAGVQSKPRPGTVNRDLYEAAAGGSLCLSEPDCDSFSLLCMNILLVTILQRRFTATLFKYA